MFKKLFVFVSLAFLPLSVAAQSYYAPMTGGATEVPNPGDPDGLGVAQLEGAVPEKHPGGQDQWAGEDRRQDGRHQHYCGYSHHILPLGLPGKPCRARLQRLL